TAVASAEIVGAADIEDLGRRREHIDAGLGHVGAEFAVLQRFHRCKRCAFRSEIFDELGELRVHHDTFWISQSTSPAFMTSPAILSASISITRSSSVCASPEW